MNVDVRWSWAGSETNEMIATQSTCHLQERVPESYRREQVVHKQQVEVYMPLPDYNIENSAFSARIMILLLDLNSGILLC
jgi:hypothetical protein